MPTNLRRLHIKRIAFVDEGANPGAHIALLKRKEEPVSKPTEAELTQRVADLEKTLTATEARLAEATALLEKATDPEPEDLEKNLPEPLKAKLAAERDAREKELAKIRKEAEEDRARIAKMEEERERTAMIRKAADFKALGKADDLGSVMYDLKKALKPEQFEGVEKLFRGWNEQIAKGALFAELGSSSPTPDSAEGKLEALARDYLKRHADEGDLTYEMAYARVLKSAEGKALNAEIQKRTRGGN